MTAPQVYSRTGRPPQGQSGTRGWERLGDAERIPFPRELALVAAHRGFSSKARPQPWPVHEALAGLALTDPRRTAVRHRVPAAGPARLRDDGGRSCSLPPLSTPGSPPTRPTEGSRGTYAVPAQTSRSGLAFAPSIEGVEVSSVNRPRLDWHGAVRREAGGPFAV
jgi:hypothetical protein